MYHHIQLLGSQDCCCCFLVSYALGSSPQEVPPVVTRISSHRWCTEQICGKQAGVYLHSSKKQSQQSLYLKKNTVVTTTAMRVRVAQNPMTMKTTKLIPPVCFQMPEVLLALLRSTVPTNPAVHVISVCGEPGILQPQRLVKRLFASASLLALCLSLGA